MNIAGTYILHELDGDISDVIGGLSLMGNFVDYTEADVKNMKSKITIQSESTNKGDVFWEINKHELKGFNSSLNDCFTKNGSSCVTYFIYNDEEYFGCINNDHDQLWCATKGKLEFRNIVLILVTHFFILSLHRSHLNKGCTHPFEL